MLRSGLISIVAGACLANTVAAQEHTLIVLSHSNFTVYQVDVATQRVINQFVAKDEPHEAAITPDMRTLFAAVPEGPHVVVLDADTLQQKGIIESEHFRRRAATGTPPRDSAAPHGVAVNNDGTKLYVGLERGEIPGLVVYDIKAGKVIKKIDLLLNGGHYLAMQPGTDKLYYPHREDNRVVVLDAKTDRVVKIIPVPGGPVGVDFAPNGEVWLHQDGDGTVAVVDSRSDEIIKTIKTTGQGAGRLAVSKDGRFVASTHRNSGDVAIIDARSKEVVANIALGAPPYLGFPLFSPDSQTLYIMEFQGGNLATIDLTTMKVKSRVKMGSDPFGGVIRLKGASTVR
jgi:YVTN family beta-propeller protein